MCTALCLRTACPSTTVLSNEPTSLCWCELHGKVIIFAQGITTAVLLRNVKLRKAFSGNCGSADGIKSKKADKWKKQKGQKKEAVA